jgi:NTE family protein
MPTAPLPPERRRWLREASRTAIAAVALATSPSAGRGQDRRSSGDAPRPPPAPAARPARVAVALGSGSRHGLVHVGVIRALQARGLRPDLVTGTSAGAIAGALWAAGLDAARIRDATRPLGWLSGLQPALPGRGLLRSDAVRAMIDAHTGGRPIEQWPTRFAAVATDLRTGHKVVLDRGPGGLAVAASSSIPALYEPVTVDGRELVDGGLVEPVPVRTARELGARVVIAVDIAYRPWEEPVRNPVDAAFQAIHIAVNALIAEQLAAADVVIRLDVHRHFLERDDPSDALVDAGERAVAAAWPRIAALGADDGEVRR